MPKAKLSKFYERKTSLKPISSQYDNITLGTNLEFDFKFSDEKDFEKKCRFVAKSVFEQTETDIVLAIVDLIKKSKDPNLQILLGIGDDAREKEDLFDGMPGFSKLLEDEDALDVEEIENKLKAEFEEVDFENFNVDLED